MAECCKRHEKGEKDCGYRFMQSSKVKGKVCQTLPHDIPMLCGNNLLEAINSQNLFKDTNLDAVTQLAYQDCTVAKTQP